MATVQSVKAKLQGLIDKSNATTGNYDKDLTTAVNTLVEGYGKGGSGVSGGSAPNLLHAGSTVEEFVAALEAWQNNGTDCGFVDGAEVCKFVAVDASGIGYFFKGSTKQLIVVTLGESVSIQYVNIGGGVNYIEIDILGIETEQSGNLTAAQRSLIESNPDNVVFIVRDTSSAEYGMYNRCMFRLDIQLVVEGEGSAYAYRKTPSFVNDAVWFGDLQIIDDRWKYAGRVISLPQ